MEKRKITWSFFWDIFYCYCRKIRLKVFISMFDCRISHTFLCFRWLTWTIFVFRRRLIIFFFYVFYLSCIYIFNLGTSEEEIFILFDYGWFIFYVNPIQILIVFLCKVPPQCFEWIPHLRNVSQRVNFLSSLLSIMFHPIFLHLITRKFGEELSLIHFEVHLRTPKDIMAKLTTTLASIHKSFIIDKLIS